MKAEDIKLGTWYKLNILDVTHYALVTGPVEITDVINLAVVPSTQFIYAGQYRSDGHHYELTNFEGAVEADMYEVSEYLPDDHPDKITRTNEEELERISILLTQL